MTSSLADKCLEKTTNEKVQKVPEKIPIDSKTESKNAYGAVSREQAKSMERVGIELQKKYRLKSS
jgi:hypothetical protein